MIYIDKYAYTSKLKKVDPTQKFIFSILTLAVCLWASKPVISIIVFFIMGYATVAIGGIPIYVFTRLMLVPITFLVIGVFTIAVNFDTRPSIFLYFIKFHSYYVGVSRIGLYEAENLFLKVLASVSCLYFLSLNTPIVDLLAVFRKFKVPELVIDIMELVYRFIFILIETADTMIRAQNSRLGYINLSTSYRSLGALLSNLFILSYKRSNDIYNALESRGYNGQLNVLEENFKKSNKIYFGMIIINIGLILLSLFLPA